MADESTAQMVNLSLVAEIVRSYVAQNRIGVDQIAALMSVAISDLAARLTTPSKTPAAVIHSPAAAAAAASIVKSPRIQKCAAE